MKESPVVPCCVVEITVLLPRTTVSQSMVPAGIRAKRAVLAALVKAPVIRMDCPGSFSLEVQKIVFDVYLGSPTTGVWLSTNV
jgi:hypothetical protein